MGDKKSFGTVLGDILGKIVVTCLFICLSSIVVALTAKFIGWLFF